MQSIRKLALPLMVLGLLLSGCTPIVNGCDEAAARRAVSDLEVDYFSIKAVIDMLDPALDTSLSDEEIRQQAYDNLSAVKQSINSHDLGPCATDTINLMMRTITSIEALLEMAENNADPADIQQVYDALDDSMFLNFQSLNEIADIYE